ncbi:MAG: hypothetical protein WD696_11955 [Bryobacteraceae bacterium]
MLDSFETRLADVIADELPPATVQLVARPRNDLAAAAGQADGVVLVVQTMSAASERVMGDDARERRGARGQYRLRTVIRLRGQVSIDAVIRPGGGAEVNERRRILMSAIDALLVAMQDEDFRTGRGFRTDEDLGFELDSFRFAGLSQLEPSPGGFRIPTEFEGIRVLYDFSGLFWPVEAEPEGLHIAALPTRLAVLPAQVPERIGATAGGADVNIPIGLDLRAMNGASPRVLARLRGASPPGSLVGDTVNVPAGWTAFVPAADGVLTVVYRPPAVLAAPTRVRVTTALSREEGPSAHLADFVIEVANA